MVTINGFAYSSDGKKIIYDYSVDGGAAKYFSNEKLFVEYDRDVSGVPKSIAIIPLLVNLMPIAWFAGFDVSVDEVDADFAQALDGLRKEWQRHYPKIQHKQSKLTIGKVVSNKIDGNRTAMLFSGGVDAFATYFRHFDENPDLITIQGADIELSDEKQWADVKKFNESEPILKANSKHYIRTNFQKFYTYHVDFLLPNLGWWGSVQHGMALIGITAPLSWVNGYRIIYIASTRSEHMEFNAWGSMPEIDNQMRWAGLQTIHDGFELRRQDKVDLIVEAVKSKGTYTTIRVCYSDLKDQLNCSVCEKCIRTMFGIMIAGADPNNFGFNADASIYGRIQNAIGSGFRSRGTQFFWQEILEKAQKSPKIFTFSHATAEEEQRAATLKKVAHAVHQPLVKASRLRKIKHTIIKKYPHVFKAYLELRRKK
jgi:hypothetical protein